MTTNYDHLREVAQRNLDTGGNRALYAHIDILSLLDELAALRKENDGLRAVVMDILKLADEHRAGGCRIFQVMTDCPLTEAARAAIGDSHE